METALSSKLVRINTVCALTGRNTYGLRMLFLSAFSSVSRAKCKTDLLRQLTTSLLEMTFGTENSMDLQLT